MPHPVPSPALTIKKNHVSHVLVRLSQEGEDAFDSYVQDQPDENFTGLVLMLEARFGKTEATKILINRIAGIVHHVMTEELRIRLLELVASRAAA